MLNIYLTYARSESSKGYDIPELQISNSNQSEKSGLDSIYNDILLDQIWCDLKERTPQEVYNTEVHLTFDQKKLMQISEEASLQADDSKVILLEKSP